MISALLIGRECSLGLPGKNVLKLCGRELMVYPILAAQNAKLIDNIFVSTDSKKIMDIAKKNGAEIIARPDELCTAKALAEDAFVHGYKEIEKRTKQKVDIVVLLFCNAPTVLASELDKGIKMLKNNPNIDSVISVTRMNMYSPLRARRLDKKGLLKPFVPFETFGDPKTMSCDRDSQGDVWFANMSFSIVRSKCLNNIKNGLLPQKWMGKNIAPLEQEIGLDIDYKWQIPVTEYWLKKNGFSLKKTSYGR